MPATDPNPKALRVVAIGGGTGLSTLLRGLKRYVATPPGSLPLSDSNCKNAPCTIRDLAAVVTVTDDGGSSGRLREDFKMLPPGDVRNCMVALSEDEHLLSRLFQFRFSQGELGGHSFGNLFVAALTELTGDSHTCLEHLTEAIRQNPRNRIQARADSDFQDMADDPRFTELLYPEV